MGVILTEKEVERQSMEVFAQFGEKWKHYASVNVQLKHEPSDALQNCGIGKVLVCAAMGESLEEKIDILRRYRYKYEIVTCDKGFGILLEQGIRADYVMICDSNVPYRWLENYVSETKGVKLLCTPYANIEWTTKWLGNLYFYVSKDAIQTEVIFKNIFSINPRVIPASSNVSNSMLVYFMTINEENKPINWGGFERYILVGYDYGWRPAGKYYAFNDPKPKRYYMNHRTLLDINGDPFFSSENLVFSAKWLYSFLTIMKAPVVNCSNRGILDYTRNADLEEELKRINADRNLYKQVRDKFDLAESTQKNADEALNEFVKYKQNIFLQEVAS